MPYRGYDKILIDVSNVYHRAYSCGNDITVQTKDGPLNTGGIALFLKMIQKIEREFLGAMGQVFFLFDNATSIEDRRKQIDPDYKANRYKKDPIFYRGLDYLNLILLSYKQNYVIVKRPNSEADDLVGALLSEFSPDERVLLVSEDLDWARAITENVHLFKGQKLYHPESFQERYGYYPTRKRICMYKAFRGDSSDNIPVGVPYLREEALLKLITSFDSLPELLRGVKKGLPYLPESTQSRILSQASRVQINYALVDYQEISTEDLKEFTFYSNFEPESLKKIYKALGFDIAQVDPRLGVKVTPVEYASRFFKPEKIKRA